MAHRALLESLKLDDLAVQRLADYLDRLAVWSRRVNLTALGTPEERVRVLVADILPALPLGLPGRLIDVGSGNGSPGLVFAALRDDIEVTLLEPRLRRWAFLREVARTMGRPGILARRQRHDTYDGPPGDTVTLRALRLPLGELAPLVAPGGRLLIFGCRPEPSAALIEKPGTAGAACLVYEHCST